MKFEKVNQEKPRTFAEIEEEMKRQGYVFAGTEYLTKMILDSKNISFQAKVVRTKEQILADYRSKLSDDLEIKLIDMEGLIQNQQVVYVFLRHKSQT
jgi:hypothetical protein